MANLGQNTELGIKTPNPFSKDYAQAVLHAVSSQADLVDLLRFAYDQNIRYFATAPSHGDAERILGDFIKPLRDRDQITVATMFGDTWPYRQRERRCSLSNLKRSVDESLKHLGRIDVLQLYEATPETLRSDDFQTAVAYAKSVGTKRFGMTTGNLEVLSLIPEFPDLTVVEWLPTKGTVDYIVGLVRLKQFNNIDVVVPTEFGPSVTDTQQTVAFISLLAHNFFGKIIIAPTNIQDATRLLSNFDKAKK